jgi:hypothetical protein
MFKMDIQLFAAGDDMAITNTRIAALNTDQTLTFIAADADTADLAQKFIYTPTGKDNKIVIGFKNTTGILAYSIAAGAGVFGAAAKTGNIAATSTEVIQIESGRYMLANGTIEITLTPAAGTKLLTNHAAAVFAIELI